MKRKWTDLKMPQFVTLNGKSSFNSEPDLDLLIPRGKPDVKIGRPFSRNERDLTPAEERIYRLIVIRGLRDKEIASETGLKQAHIKNEIHQILEKMGVKSRVELTISHWKGKT